MKPQKQSQNKQERGITLIALMLTIVIIVILVAVTIKSITGDHPIIGTSVETVEDHKIVSYKEQIEQTIHSKIVSKSMLGEMATTGELEKLLNDQDWTIEVSLNPSAKAEAGDVVIQTNEGYVFQAYYNNIYGYTDIEYIGKDLSLSKKLTINATYEKTVAQIYATSEEKSGTVVRHDLIHKYQIIGGTDNPSGLQKYKIADIGTGWYKVKATSSSGATKFAWVKASNTKDSLTKPNIDVETESEQSEQGWYNGKKGTEKEKVWVKISTTSPSAKTIHYVLSGAHNEPEKSEPVEGTGEKSIRFEITETGRTNIVAWTQDETDNYQSDDVRGSVKFDNIPPEVEVEEDGTEGQGGWYTSDVELTVKAEDLNGKNRAEVEDPTATINGYNYTLLREDGTELKKETHIQNLNTTLLTTNLAPEDGIYIFHITAEDLAENKSPTKVVTVQKDTTPPTINGITVTNETEKGFTVTVDAEDVTSGIKEYQYYLNGNLANTTTSATWTPTNLDSNQTYNVTVKAVDRAGLVSNASNNVPVITKGELLPPDVDISGEQRNGYYIGDVTITVRDTAQEGKSRVNKIKVTGAGTERTINGTSGSFTITTDGTYNISAWSEDSAGAKSSATTKPAFTRDATAPTTASLSLGTVEDKKIQVTATGYDATSGIESYKFEYKPVAETEWKTADTKPSTMATCDYTYEELKESTSYDLRVTVTDKAGWTYTGNSINAKTAIIPTIETDIGKYVDYKPTSGSYTAYAKHTGIESNQTFSTETADTALKWRIWKVDNDNLYLISDYSTTERLDLYGALGYNNGVTLLDNLCSSCYKNSNYSGITVRNLKIEDVIEVTTATIDSQSAAYNTAPDYYQIQGPYIWNQYEQSKENSINNRSTAYALTTRTTLGVYNISPYYNLWSASLNFERDYINAKYHELILQPANRRYYWLSSRVVTMDTEGCYFGLAWTSHSPLIGILYKGKSWDRI